MESIAVYVNNNGVTASLTEDGIIQVYTFKDGEWTLTRKIEFSPSQQVSLAEYRKVTAKVVEDLKECKTFVAKKVVGQLFFELERNSFNTYEEEGEPASFLEAIRRSDEQDKKILAEIELNEKSGTNIKPYPEKMMLEGVYQINLIKVMKAYPSITSKKAILPFLANQKFATLEVVCEHVPKWFEAEMKRLHLDLDVAINESGEFHVTIASTC